MIAGLALSNGLVGNLGLALSWGARTVGVQDFPAHGTIDGQPLPRPGDHAAWREKLQFLPQCDAGYRLNSQGTACVRRTSSPSSDGSTSDGGTGGCFSWLSDKWLPYTYTTADQEGEGEMPGGRSDSDGPGGGAGGAGGIGLTDEAAWQYAFHFGTISTQPVWSAASDGCFVRRRQLCRLRQLGATASREPGMGECDAAELWAAFRDLKREEDYREAMAAAEYVAKNSLP